MNLTKGHCQNPRCEEDAKKWCKDWTEKLNNELGPLRARTDVYHVVTKTAWRRCKKCRRAHSVHQGNPLYSLRDRLDEATYAWWMFVHGASLTLAALHLGRKEDVVRRHYHHTATICAFDAVHRQVLNSRKNNGNHEQIMEIIET